MKRGKVNPPAKAKAKRARRKDPYKNVTGRHPLESGETPSGKFLFWGLALVVATLVAGVVLALKWMPRMRPENTTPWADYGERLIEEEGRGKVYSYRPGEVRWWVAKAGNEASEDAEVLQVTALAARHLEPEDAVAVLEAGWRSHPQQRVAIGEMAERMREGLIRSDPEQRALDERLKMLIAGPVPEPESSGEEGTSRPGEG